MKKTLLSLLLLAAVVLLCAAYMGAFHHVTIAEEDRGPFTFVYVGLGADELKNVGPVTTQVDAMLDAAGVTQRKPLDVFLPDSTAEVGFAVEGASPDQLANLPGKAAVKEIPVQRCMVTVFPWRNRLSFMFGFMKVDPALGAYRAAHGYVKTEAMAMVDGGEIVYMQRIDRP
jgi:hypothetical protein